MYTSVFALILAATSLASAAPSQRDTKKIICKEPSATGRKVKLQTHANETLGYVAFNGQRDGQGRQNLVTLNADGSPSTGSHFIFKPCISKTLGYKPIVGDQDYGLLYWASSPQHCVTISQVKGTNARFVNAKCSYDDDESQLGQFWSLSSSSQSLTLIEDARGHDDGYYALSIGDTQHKKVQVDWYSGAANHSGNSLVFE